jgi:hypothetical protein
VPLQVLNIAYSTSHVHKSLLVNKELFQLEINISTFNTQKPFVFKRFLLFKTIIVFYKSEKLLSLKFSNLLFFASPIFCLV